jgi:hypothetical protein
MTVKDLTIGSPVYRVQLDSIDIARVRLVEQFQDGTRSVELNTSWKPRCVAKEEATEIHETNSSERVWYLNVEDAELAQLMRRSEHVERLKKAMENAQNQFADAIQRYAFSEPSTPKEL